MSRFSRFLRSNKSIENSPISPSSAKSENSRDHDIATIKKLENHVEELNHDLELGNLKSQSQVVETQRQELRAMNVKTINI